jgi:hypothetical protein
MIGNTYWSTGVKLTPREEGHWSVGIEFCDAGFCEHDSTKGTLCLRYQIPTEELERGIGVLLQDAKRLQIGVSPDQEPLCLYIEGDGEWERIPYPQNWREIMIGLASKFQMMTYSPQGAGMEIPKPANSTEGAA